MTQILFVDDEPEILSGLRRMLRGRRDRWTMQFAASSLEALDALDATQFDVVVSDMRMPGMDGASLLTEVRERQPGAVRIVLSGHAQMTNSIRSLPVAHQFLAKPCDPARLEAAIERSLLLRDRLTSPELRDFVGGLGCLPSPSGTVVALQGILAVRPVDAERLAQLINADMAITTKVLQVANSAFFGLPRTLSDPIEAVNYLGAQALCDLVTSAEVFRSLAGRGDRIDAEIERVQSRSTQRAEIASDLARRADRSSMVAREIWVGAFLADVGSLLLLSSERPTCLAMQEGTEEDRALYAMVPIIGAYLISMWGLPHHLVEAVALSDDAPQPHGCEAAGFTWLARHLLPGGPDPADVTDAHLDAVGLSRGAFDQAAALWKQEPAAA